MEKPHLYLDKKTFDNEKDGYFLGMDNEIPYLLCYNDEQLIRLTRINKFLKFETKQFKVKLNSDNLRIVDVDIKEKLNFEIDLQFAAKMNLILQGAVSFHG